MLSERPAISRCRCAGSACGTVPILTSPKAPAVRLESSHSSDFQSGLMPQLQIRVRMSRYQRAELAPPGTVTGEISAPHLFSLEGDRHLPGEAGPLDSQLA